MMRFFSPNGADLVALRDLSGGGIMPVTATDGKPVGDGVPGPLTTQLRDRYWASHADPRYAAPVRYDEP